MDVLTFLNLRGLCRAAWLAGALAGLTGCSLAIDHSAEQCSSDADCNRFRATCNLTTKLCVSRGPSVDARVIQRSDSADSGDTGTEGGADAQGTTDASDGGAPESVAMSMTASAPGWPCARTDKPLVRLQGDIGFHDRLICENDYLLVGPVFVRPGVILTIDAGTTILGDVVSKGMLIVQPGARVLADGLRMAPIVFTSAAAPGARRAGDWGGVVLLGRALCNRQRPVFPVMGQSGEYGGIDDEDTSGVLRFVRIEYSGGANNNGNETPGGLALRGVGRATALNHVMVRETAGDCFQFFGGTARAKHLICQHSGDDGFDWREGYRGKLQFLAYQGGTDAPPDSHGIEGESDTATDALNLGSSPVSEPVIYNATLCGHRSDPPGEQFGVSLRRGIRAHINNAIVTGFEAALAARGDRIVLDVRSTLVWPHVGGAVETRLFNEPERRNAVSTPNIGDCFNGKQPGFAPSPAIKSNATLPPGDGFFEPVAHLGAFRDLEDDWARGSWVTFAER